ncbi:MAG: cysteine hydrolase [Chloroflexi bacterium]|nr:cysteine hydrolase [Chloroflexota bacterium]
MVRPSFMLEPGATALVVVDMQYASASRADGMGKAAAGLSPAEAGALAYRFDRLERVVVPAIQKLLRFFREHRLRVVYLTNGSEMPDYWDCLPHRRAGYEARNNKKGAREHEILDEIRPLGNECVINKTTTSPFNSTNIDMILARIMGIRYLLFTGVSTNLCVENTARDAYDLGYRCVMVEDGCATTEERFHHAALEHFAKYFGRVDMAVDLIGELSAARKTQHSEAKE